MSHPPSVVNNAMAYPVKPPACPLSRRIFYGLREFIVGVNWVHVAFKVCAYTYIAFMAWIAWHVIPVPGHWSARRRPIPSTRDYMADFSVFRGQNECNIKAKDLYLPRPIVHPDVHSANLFCSNRKALLHSMSSGGRIGYDTPYIPKDCQYSWYDVDQICMILERFDGVIFLGDESLQPIYSGLNILLRQDLVLGALQTWSFGDMEELKDCSCENQFTRQPCLDHVISSSEQVTSNTLKHNSGHSQYACSRTPHVFLKIGGNSPGLPAQVVEQFNAVAPRRPPSSFQHIPIVVSISPAVSMSTSIQSATSAFISIIELAKATGRKTDILYIGPTAPGHTTLRDHKSNQEIWNFHRAMAKVAHENKADVLGMWNLTVQANSWDGVRFGESVAITQAMMVMNWMSRLETS